MHPPDRIEVATALYGAWRLIRGDVGGSAYFRGGRDGFWAASWAIVLVLPAHLLTLAVFVAGDPAVPFGLLDAVREAEVLAIGWFGYALLAHAVLTRLGRPGRFDGYMTAYFWTTVPLAYAHLALTVVQATDLLPDALSKLLTLAFLLLLLWARWFVARNALAMTGAESAMVVAGTVMFDWSVATILSPLL